MRNWKRRENQNKEEVFYLTLDFEAGTDFNLQFKGLKSFLIVNCNSPIDICNSGTHLLFMRSSYRKYIEPRHTCPFMASRDLQPAHAYLGVLAIKKGT